MGKSEAKEDTLCAEYIKSLLEGENSNLDNEIAVSYTHLTLPTILLV